MKIFVFAMIVCLARSQDFNHYEACPYPCECTVSFHENGPIVDVNCYLAWIDGNSSDFSTLKTNVTSVLHMECSDLYLSDIPDNAFEDLFSFEEVEIKSCKFDTLRENSLYGLSSLLRLYIYGARKLVIHENVFKNMLTIQRLTIIFSGIENVPSLRDLRHLEFINFTRNNIKDLSNTDFSYGKMVFKSLIVLDLTFNQIEKINITFSKTMPAIKYISISDNMLWYIHPDSFTNLMYLEYLDLSGNRITHISQELLRDNLILRVFGVGSNPLLQVPDGFFNFTKEIHALDLHKTYSDESIFGKIQNLNKLKELHLEDCKIKFLTNDSLENFEMLWILNLTNNKIETIENNTFLNQLKLKTLYLSVNILKDIDVFGFKGLQALQNLYLDGNKIESIHPEVFSFVPSLILLNMSNNELLAVPSLHSLNHLYVLDLRHNKISNINNATFKGLKSLAGMNIAFNNLRAIRRHYFEDAPVLQLLQLSHNRINYLDIMAFQKLKQLKWLFLAENDIKDISNVFIYLPELIQLELSHNKISGNVKAAYFYGSNKLQEIYMSYNDIKGIEPSAFSHLPYLDLVDLRKNSITTLIRTHRLFAPFGKRPPTLRISRNPFNCDCRIAWMRKCVDNWLDSCKALDVRELELFSCYSGYKIKFFSLLKNANVENMLCKYNPCGAMCDCCHKEVCKCRTHCPDNCTCLESDDRNHVIIDCSNKNLTEILNIPPTASTFYLSGNTFNTLNYVVLRGLYRLENAYLNSSRIVNIQFNCFDNLTRLQSLYLNNNNLTSIGSMLFFRTVSLEYINLEHNSIKVIAPDAFASCKNIKTLLLAYNELTYISDNIFVHSTVLSRVSLANNSFSCDCNMIDDLYDTMFTSAHIIEDRKEVFCRVNNTMNSTLQLEGELKILELDLGSLCPNETIQFSSVETLTEVLNHTQIRALTATLAMLVLLVLITTILIINRHLLQVVLYNKFGIRICHEQSENNKEYDAFVSYSHKDESFVVHELVPKLETHDGFKLCVHFRDFPIGACIADTIIDSVEKSKRTIMIVSNNFLDSEWCQYEFKTAHHKVLQEKSKKIIMILMENIDTSKIDKDLKLYMKTKTYLKRQDPWFWEKLEFAMPENISQQMNDLDKVNIELEENVQHALETSMHKNIC